MAYIWLVGFAAYHIGVILYVAGFRTDSWSTATIGGKDITYDMAGTCNLADEGCPALIVDGQDAVLGLLIAGSVLNLIALILQWFEYWKKTDKEWIPKLGQALGCLAGLLIMIGVGIYGDKINPPHFELGYSFGLTTAGAVLLFLGSAALLLENIIQTHVPNNCQAVWGFIQGRDSYRNIP